MFYHRCKVVYELQTNVWKLYQSIIACNLLRKLAITCDEESSRIDDCLVCGLPVQHLHL